MRLGTRHTITALLLCLTCHHERVDASSRSVDSAYDTNKGVFSPQGRLVQLDYVEGIVKRGNLCMAAKCKDGVVLMTNKLTTADAAKLVDGGVRRIYRVDSHIGILPAGLPADGRALAQKAMEYCRSHRREYGEPMPGWVLADRLGEHIHATCVRWGSRAYPNELFVACWDGDGEEEDDDRVLACDTSRITNKKIAGRELVGARDELATARNGRDLGEEKQEGLRWVKKNGDRNGDDLTIAHGFNDEEEATVTAVSAAKDTGFQLYVVDPGGVARRYQAACSGRGSTRAREWLRRQSLLHASDAATSEDAGSKGERLRQQLARSGEPTREETDGGLLPGEGGGDDRGGEGSRDSRGGDDSGMSIAGQKRCQPRRPLFSEMTCAEAARAMVEEARRFGDNSGKKPLGQEAGTGNSAGPGGDVAGSAEVAWLSLASPRKESKEGNPCFVHYRSVEELFEEAKSETRGLGEGGNGETGGSDSRGKEG